MAYASVSTMRPPAAPSASTRTSILPTRKRASSAVSTGISARSSTRGVAAAAPISSHSLDPLRARRPGFERVGEVLGLAGHLAIPELHDAHRIGRPAVIGEDEFRHPEVAATDNAADREALRVRLRDARGLDIVPAPDARSPDCGYSRIASSRYMSCSTSKSFASEAAQWRLSASRISFSSILLLLPFLVIEARPHRAIAR